MRDYTITYRGPLERHCKSSVRASGFVPIGRTSVYLYTGPSDTTDSDHKSIAFYSQVYSIDTELTS